MESKVITFFDIKRLFFKNRKRIFRFAYLGAFLGLLHVLSSEVKYKAEATFKEGKENVLSSDMTIQDLIGSTGVSTTKEGKVIALMNSNAVIKPVICKLGIQIQVLEKNVLMRAFKRCLSHIRAEFGTPIKDDFFLFQDVIYEKDTPFQSTISFLDENHFVVGDVKGILGSRVGFNEGSFILKKKPASLKIGKKYTFLIQPWQKVKKELQTQFKMNNLKIAGKVQKSIYQLKFSSSNPYLSAHFLNEMMLEYQNYLRAEHGQIVEEQLQYLEGRKEEICQNLSGVFDDYTLFLQKYLSSDGALGLNEQVAGLSKSYREIAKRLDVIYLELERIDFIQKEGKIGGVFQGAPFSSELQTIFSHLQDLKQERDLIALSFQERGLIDDAALFFERKNELEEIRKKKELLISTGVEQFLGNDFVAHLDNRMRLLTMKEEIVKNEFFYSDMPVELQGIGLPAARSLILEYQKELDKAALQVEHFNELKRKMLEDDLALSSLGQVLTDPLSRHLIDQATQMIIHLKDKEHCSEREKERWQNDLSLQKNILEDHLEELALVEKMKIFLTKEKMSALQKGMVKDLGVQISAKLAQIDEIVIQEKEGLLQEKMILEKRLSELRNAFDHFPEQWRKEKWMNFKTELGLKLISSVAELVESKTIGSHLHHIESKEIDLAYLPTNPTKRLFIYTLISLFLFGFGSFAHLLLKAFLDGFPASIPQLKAMKYPVIGANNEETRGVDLKMLRELSLFFDGFNAKIGGLFLGKGPDYSDALGAHFAKKGVSSLFIRGDFSSKNGDEEIGILQLYNQEIDFDPIVKKDGYDMVYAGGYYSHGTELISSKFFLSFLERISKGYDIVCILIQSSLDSIDTMTALKFCDYAVVSVMEESVEKIHPFMDFAKKREKSVNFIVMQGVQ